MRGSELLYKNGDSYVGEVHSETQELNGKGNYKFRNGSEYEGEFKNNAFWGRGKLRDAFNETTIIG